MHTCTPTHTLAQIQVLKLICILSLKITEHKQQLECCLQKHSCIHGFFEEQVPSLARILCQKGVLQVLYSAFWKLRVEQLFGSSRCWWNSTPALCVRSQHWDCSARAACVYLFPLPEYIQMVIQLITTQLHLCWEPADRKHCMCSWEGTHWHP